MLTDLPEKVAEESEEELKMYQLTQQQKELYTLTGREEGREEKEREIALNLMSLRVPISVIAQSVGRDEVGVLNL